MDGAHSDMLMDFGILRLKSGQKFEEDQQLERAYILVYGDVNISWDGNQRHITRRNSFDDSPWVLHVPKGVKVTITGVGSDSEISVHRTKNNALFDSRLYTPEEIADEYRGAGLMQETSTRIVRTVLDKKTTPWSNFVLGEVVGFPGKWSSYPPHYHTQPEIYYYKFNPENGFAFCDSGDEVYRLKHNDTICFTSGQIHPHATAPGYALWCVWVIRHLDDDPHLGPTYVEEHKWMLEPGAKIWGDK